VGNKYSLRGTRLDSACLRAGIRPVVWGRSLPAISVAAALEPAQARVAYPTKVAEWLTLAPLAASSAVMFYFRCCNVLQDISLFNAARTVGGNNEAAALPRVGGLMPGPHQF